MTLMGLGMWLYDVLSLWEAPELHARLDVTEVAARFPQLNTKIFWSLQLFRRLYGR